MGKLTSTLWLVLIMFPQQVLANSQYNMRKGVTIFLICCVIGVIVFAIMFWALIHHRKSKGAVPAQFHESTKVEILWTARRSNQSIPKEINLEYSLDRLMLKVKLQSFGHLMQRADSLKKTLMLGKIEGRRRRG